MDLAKVGGGGVMNELAIMMIKAGVLILILLQVVPVMVWVERRGSALMQNRLGPNRVGPLGLFQSLADVLKFTSKEHFAPGHVNKFFYLAAPIVMLFPAFMTFAVIPIAAPITFNGYTLNFQVTDLNVGILYIFAIASLGVYGVVMAGWSSNNKYSLLGSLRSTSQMISYELSMGLSVIGLIMIFSSLKLGDIAAGQGAALITIAGITIPKWGIFVQPLGFIIFLTAVFAETNRLPFDLPEGESEIVAGYHLEYGPAGFAVFMMAEYINMTVASALLATLYFGGWQMLPGMHALLTSLGQHGLSTEWLEWARVGLQAASFLGKVLFFLWFFVWVRWTIPRFRYDQLMDLGWKVMLPLSLINIFVTGAFIYLGWV
ncbi:MAG: NADH-quinone oxidoreductase subunit NuoH [Bdellovibrionota bacterium]